MRQFPAGNCQHCGKPIRDGRRKILGYAYDTADGEKIRGSEQHLGTFHTECWAKYKAEHPDTAF